jgi:hypothetical protein
MNYETLSFSEKLSQQRIAQAVSIMGWKVVQKILAYALFLLGLNRNAISSFLEIPPGSVRSLVLSMNNRGLVGFEDQRAKNSSFKPPLPTQIKPTLKTENSWLQVDFGLDNLVLRIPESNTLQKKVALLSMVNSNLLTRAEVAKALHLSVDRTGKLARKLQQEDVGSILDRRQGQKQDYRFTPEIKAQLIEQFVIEAVGQGNTSGEQLAKKLHERCQLILSPRSILFHLSKLGLSTIRVSLPENLAEVKKTLSTLEE